MLLCLCKPSGFCLSPLLPSGVGLSHCPSSPYCSTAARCRRSSRLLVLSQSPLPLHSLSTGTAVLLGLSCPLPSGCHLSCSVSGSTAGTTPFFSGKSWHSSGRNLSQNFPTVLQRNEYEPGPTYQGIKIAHRNSPFIPQSSTTVKDSEQPRVQLSKGTIRWKHS